MRKKDDTIRVHALKTVQPGAELFTFVMTAHELHEIAYVGVRQRAGPADAYQRSGELFKDWLGSGVLVTESEPAVYLYQQRFNGNIARFSGTIPYSSTKKAMKTTVNFKDGAMTIFPYDTKGISPKDLRWLVTMLENNADPYPAA